MRDYLQFLFAMLISFFQYVIIFIWLVGPCVLFLFGFNLSISNNVIIGICIMLFSLFFSLFLSSLFIFFSTRDISGYNMTSL